MDARTLAKQERRAQLEAELASKILGLPDKRYGVVLADPGPTHAFALTGTPSFSAHGGRPDIIRSMVSLAMSVCSTTISSCTVKTIG